MSLGILMRINLRHTQYSGAASTTRRQIEIIYMWRITVGKCTVEPNDTRTPNIPLILMYHSVAERHEDPYLMTVTPERFDKQLRSLSRQGLRGVTLRELVNAWQAGRSRGLVGLTFDDGYADFRTEALPVLQRYGFTCTIFVLAGDLGSVNYWDVLGPRKALMSGEDVRVAAAAGMEIGSHGMSHVSLPAIADISLAAQLERSRSDLRELTGGEIAGFAYPFGHLGDREVAAARAAGYEYACAVWATGSNNMHALPRTYVGERDTAVRLLAKRIRHRLAW
jgi:peptidoglycan/xylan/chitin deacetylase (PgdA/CDA1 family)